MLPAKTVTIATGSMEMRHVGTNIVYVVCEGLGDAPTAQVLVDYCESVLDFDGGPLVSFHDWYAMKGYDPGARKILTDWNIRQRKQVKHIHILTKLSGIAAMGVSVASLALPFLTHYSDPTVFREAARSAGIVIDLGSTQK